jgi:hypothetical protein
MIESGLFVFTGLMLVFLKLPRRTILKLLGYPLTVDICVSLGTYVLHFGTFSGVMAATVAGLMCSAFTSFARWLVGYMAHGKYHPGVFQLDL